MSEGAEDAGTPEAEGAADARAADAPAADAEQAEDLQRPVLPGDAPTDYERYLKVPELLSLQKPLDELSHHDELLFQTVHQASELWFKLALFEMETAAERMDDGAVAEATRLVRRATRAMVLLKDHLHLLDTMSPWDFHAIRRGLGHGSGAESPGFGRILREVPPLYKHFEDLLDRRGVALADVYRDPGGDGGGGGKSDGDGGGGRRDLFELAEALIDFDQAFQLWRADHLHLVKRIIGGGVKSLKGYEVEQLEEDIKVALFPKLWDVRNALTGEAGTSPD